MNQPPDSLLFARRRCRGVISGWTLTEVLVVIVLAAILLFLSYSALTKSTLKARKMADAANLRSIWVAAELWSNDHKGHIIPGDDQLLFFGGERSWFLNLTPYLAPPRPPDRFSSTLISPANPKKNRSYNINHNLRANARGTPKKLAITAPSQLMYFGNSTAAESHWIRPLNFDQIPRDWYGDDTANFLFVDGHVESIIVEQIIPPNGSRSEIFSSGLPQ